MLQGQTMWSTALQGLGFCRVSNVLLTSGNEPCLRHALVSCSIRMSLASQEEQRVQWPADAPFKPLSCVQLM